MSGTENEGTSRRAVLRGGLAAGAGLAVAGAARAEGTPDPLITEVQD